jgi:hypothetical protein
MPPVETLHLPRPLVNQLLHQAQQSPGFSQGFVRRDRHGHYPCTALPMNADLVATSARVPAPGIFAFYRSSHTPLLVLTAQEAWALGQCTTLYLGVSLNTKGVLQLRAWRIDGSRLLETDVTITEAET